MTHNAGERFFEAIGQIPEEMILEAERDRLEEEQGRLDASARPQRAELPPERGRRRRRLPAPVEKLGGYLKYLPVAVCMCIVFGSAYYILDSYYHWDSAPEFSMYDSGGDSAEKSGQMPEVSGGMSQEDGTLSEPDSAGGTVDDEKDMAQGTLNSLPVCYDVYEGPVMAMTATGDTQKLKTARSLKGAVTTEQPGGNVQPVFDITDIYQIENTSSEDKTLQIVYPFAATLNLAYDLEGEILQVHGQDNPAVTYGIGGGISAYQNREPGTASTMKDYAQLFDDGGDYQERALEKEADWSREVSVYTFSDISVQEDRAALNNPGVVGVTVRGADADVLTCGFDHSFKMDGSRSKYCFIASAGQPQLILIVTGEQEGEPELDYYANLDCEDKIEGIACTMQKQKMPYADALRRCSAAAVKQTREDYAEGKYAGELPEYMDVNAAYQALTIISGEEAFFNTLKQRYQSTELMEVYEKLFGETRIVYAMATISIPAGKSAKVTARTQKRQPGGHYNQPEGSRGKEEYGFDFLSSAKSRLNIGKTAVRLEAEGWRITDNDMGLKQYKSVWKADLKKRSYHFIVSQ